MIVSESDAAASLQELRRNGKLILFVGAGLSVPLGLPTWSKLIDNIAGQLGYDPEVFKLNGNHLQLAEYYVAVKGSIGPLRSEMDRMFNPSDKAIQDSITHQAILKLNLPLIYTTNYDAILERAFRLSHTPFYPVANIDDLAAAPPDVTQIVKFHGTFSDDTSLVITESSYFDRLEFESPLDIKLRADILGKSLLFIGYSFTDINMRYMLYKLHKLRRQVNRETLRLPSAYLTTFGSGEVQRKLLERWDVEMLELDPLNKTESLARFLETL